MLQADITHSTGWPPAHVARTTPETLLMVLALPAGPACNVLAFPPRPRQAAALAGLVQQLAPAELLPLAHRAIGAAQDRSASPGAATANLHAVYAALLACARLLDDACYPWEAALSAGPVTPVLHGGAA